MVNYNNSIIYKLCCKDINVKDIYVGSTTNFIRRKCEHKSKCNNINDKYYNLNVYQFIRDNGNINNWDMVLIEEFECNNKLELHKRERYYIEQLGATLNSNIPNRSKNEWYEDNKDKFKDKNKKYREANKDKIKEQKKEKVHCDICNKEMRKDSLNRHNKKLHN